MKLPLRNELLFFSRYNKLWNMCAETGALGEPLLTFPRHKFYLLPKLKYIFQEEFIISR